MLFGREGGRIRAIQHLQTVISPLAGKRSLAMNHSVHGIMERYPWIKQNNAAIDSSITIHIVFRDNMWQGRRANKWETAFSSGYISKNW